MVAIVSYALGALYLVGLAAATASMLVGPDAADPEMSWSGFGFMLLIITLIIVGFAGGATGLLRRRTWGWWCTIVSHGVLVLLLWGSLLSVTFLIGEDSEGRELLFILVLTLGAPGLLSLAMMALLMLARKRVAGKTPSPPIADPDLFR